MTMMKRTTMWILAAALMLPAAALAGDEAEGTDTAEDAPAPGSKEAAQKKKDEAPAAGSKEAAEQKKAAAAAAAAEGTDEAVEGTDEAVEAAPEAVEETVEEEVEETVEEAVEEAVEETVEEAVEEEPLTAVVTEAELAVTPKVGLSIEAGANWAAGNTKSINASGAVAFSVAHARNKFSLDFGGAYGRGVVADSGSDEWVELAKNVGGAVRYDRFIIPDINSIYVGGGALHDPLAGFLIQARGDVGYSHKLINTEKHSLLAEGGFNYSRDQYVPVAEGGTGGGQNFVGGRIAGAYALNVGGNFGFTQKLEALLGGRNNQDAGEEGFDGKIVSATGISGSFNSIMSVKFGFKLGYDFVPPVRADGTSFEALDTLTSITIVATLM